jgi:pyruvate formate-lyase activating enzyme-like uncharacterized protein
VYFASLVSLVISICSAHAHDAAAPRSRTASMEASYASGFYDSIRTGTLALNYSDNGSPYSLTLSVRRRKLTARVWQAEESRCGNTIYARLSVPNESRSTSLELRDYSAIRCRLYVKHAWRAVISTSEPDGSESRMELEGDPSQ